MGLMDLFKKKSCRMILQTVFYIRGLEKERWLPLLKVGEIMRLQSSLTRWELKKCLLLLQN